MAKYAIYLTDVIYPDTAKPVRGLLEVSDLPAADFATRLADQVALLNAGEATILVKDTAVLTDLDSDANTYDYTVDITDPDPELTPVSTARFSLAQKQAFVKERRDFLLASGLQLLAGDRVMTDTDLGTIATYLAALRAISDTEASPDTVVFPTLGALSNNASANLLTRSYRRGNAVGSVSLSGGIPAGALFQTETNSNGLLYRTADGFQVCRARLLLTYFSATRLAATFNFAGAFYNDIAWSIDWSLSTRDNSNTVDGLADTDLAKLQFVTGARSTTSVVVSLIVNGSGLTLSSGDEAWVDVGVKGRWAAP